MSYMKWAFCAGILFLAAAALPLRAQSNQVIPASAVSVISSSAASTATSPDDPILTIKKRVDEVNLLFIATDKHGKFVRDLNQADVTILDDHKPPQSIANFRRE